MPMFLLDTNVCIAVINGRPASVLQRLNRSDPQRSLSRISTISIFELRYGVAKSARPRANAEALETFLKSASILAFDEDDAKFAGNIRAELERGGKPIGPYDYLIAAQALRHDCTLVTANEREFARVPKLRWENWSA